MAVSGEQVGPGYGHPSGEHSHLRSLGSRRFGRRCVPLRVEISHRRRYCQDHICEAPFLLGSGVGLLLNLIDISESMEPQMLREDVHKRCCF